MVTDQEVKNRADLFARRNRLEIARKLTNIELYPPDKHPVSVFMAGSPGAGKTEFSKQLISIIERGSERRVVRIDGDELKNNFYDYNGGNSNLFQGASSLIVEKVHECVLHNSQSFILDSTLSNYNRGSENIHRSLKRGRPIMIFYVYQNPTVAWKFTQAREKSEGRNIPKDVFIDLFFLANENVAKLLTELGDQIAIFLVKKNFEQNTEKITRLRNSIPSIDELEGERYTKNALKELL